MYISLMYIDKCCDYTKNKIHDKIVTYLYLTLLKSTPQCNVYLYITYVKNIMNGTI